MTSQPFNAAALRGAVDLSSLAQPPAGQAPAGAPGSGGAGAAGGSGGMVVDVDAQGFSNLVNASMRHAVVITLWASSQPASRGPVDMLVKAVRAQAGRVQLGVVDIDKAPEIAQAFQQLGESAQLPAGTPLTTVAFVQGQPMPLPPLPSDEAAQQLLDEVVKVAVSNGVAGRVSSDDADAEQDEQPEEEAESALPPLHQEAYDAIERGDLDAAADAYHRALEANPADSDAKLGLGQVALLQRTAGVDATQARAAAAEAPTDVAAQSMVADLDVLGGHVEDAFLRLIELVRATSDDERNAAREHLLGLFDVVGTGDERVRKARSALTNALF